MEREEKEKNRDDMTVSKIYTKPRCVVVTGVADHSVLKSSYK